MRLGSDKALLDPYGDGPLLAIGVEALRDGGCEEIVSVGGPARTGLADDVLHVPDLHPGEGPLGGIITALRHTAHDMTVVFACDMPFIDGEVVSALVARAVDEPRAAVVVARVWDRAQPLTAVWRRSLALEALERGFAAGMRAPRLILPVIDCRYLDRLDPDRLVDIDSTEDVERYAPAAQRRRAGE